VMPLLSMDMPVDHPDLEPIWKAAQAHDLAVVHHSFTWNPPYFPGYRDLWDNIFLGRLASHPWGAMRFIAAFIGSGIMDRYADLRLGVLECGNGWLPFWGKRMDEQATYVGGIAQLKHRPSEYLRGGRFFCSLDIHEGEDMFDSVTSSLGDQVLMFSTDYPHAECLFPDSVDQVLSWSSLKPDTQQKLFWDNATRFFKQT
jgi:predicted TIM-barrel fold metal-dependent hydrolase